MSRAVQAESNADFASRMRLKREGYECAECGARTSERHGGHECAGVPHAIRIKLKGKGCAERKMLCPSCRRCETCSTEHTLRTKEVRKMLDIDARDSWAVATIAERARELFTGHFDIPTYQLRATLKKAHDHSPLRLEKLAHASDDDIRHDVSGILRHCDPDTGDVGTFLPRWATR